MRSVEWMSLLEHTCRQALAWLESVPERKVPAQLGPEEMLARFARAMPDEPCDPRAVIDELVSGAEPGITAMAGGRFFGWVIGGALPAAVAADWMTSVWDQNAGSSEGTPAAAAVEQVALGWVAELLELPAASAVMVTGATMASFVGLATARSEVLRRVGWDVEADGLDGAPRVRVIVGAERHGTIDKALRLLGFGTRRLVVVGADREGRMDAAGLARALAEGGPAIVCAQAGNVNGGSFDPMPPIVDAVAQARERAPVWLHVDGAFGLWARVSPRLRALADGVEHADSWSTDAHKWLNTPYDCGIALVRDATAHRRALRGAAAYLPDDVAAVRTAFDHAPELSRRARGFAVWAALRQLGRRGVIGLVERSCDHAARLATGLAAIPGAEVMNEVRLNQIVVRFGDDARTRAILAAILSSGECYPTPTTWRGAYALRFSLSSWATDHDDIDRTLRAVTLAASRLP